MFKKSDFVIFKSNRKNKKYYAILKTELNEKHPKKVYFGAIKPDGSIYQQFRDSTPLKLYSEYDHNDRLRQERYIKRHHPIINGFNSNYLSYIFLWK